VNMGALAQVVPWIPEDDLLLKNAVEVSSHFIEFGYISVFIILLPEMDYVGLSHGFDLNICLNFLSFHALYVVQ